MPPRRGEEGRRAYMRYLQSVVLPDEMLPSTAQISGGARGEERCTTSSAPRPLLLLLLLLPSPPAAAARAGECAGALPALSTAWYALRSRSRPCSCEIAISCLGVGVGLGLGLG